MDEPVAASLGEGVELIGNFVIIHSGHTERDGVSVFYDFLSVSNRYNKLAKFTWQKNQDSEEGNLVREDFVFPNLPAPDPDDWRSFLFSYSAAIPTTLNACKEAYKLNKGANFSEETLFLVNLSQPIDVQSQSKPLSEALFDVGTDEFTVAINKHETTIANNVCNIGDRAQLEAVIKNLRILPAGALPNNQEYSFSNLSIVSYQQDS